MSYARFSDESDVYVYEAADYWVCYGCIFLPNNPPHNTNHDHTGSDYVAFDRESMVVHLEAHRQYKHKVPQEAIDRFLEEINKESAESQPMSD